MDKLAVVYFPQIDLVKINLFRKKYDQNYRIIAPHITIVAPLSDLSQDQLILHCKQIAKKISTFSIHLTEVTRTTDDCIFLLVKEGNKEIIRLYEEIYTGILSSYKSVDFTFVPHLTIGDFGINNDGLSTQAFSEAKSLKIDIKDTFNAITIIKGNGFDSIKIVKTITLQNIGEKQYS